MDARELAHVIADAVGADVDEVQSVRPAAGGDVSRAAIALVAGERTFVKHVDPAVPGLLQAEAAGLRWLRQAEALRVPQVLGCSPATAPVQVLVLEHIETGRPAPDHDQRLGEGLAGVHRAGADRVGAPWPGFVGPLRHPKEAPDEERDWPTFFGEQRLRPAAAAAHARGALPDGTLNRLDRLIDRLPELAGPPEPPSRLHGDLWAGNAMVDAGGGPVLVDPAAFGGHREVDLAMMQLFGGFGPQVIAAYESVHPLAEGHRSRTALYQLHPLLVHAALFGGHYGTRARRVIDTYV